jgi:hypothetical protein
MRGKANRRQWAVRILCAIALLFVAFGHQPITLAQSAPIDLAAYALPDGTLPIFCVTDREGSQKGKHLHIHPCDACRIGASALLPQPNDTFGQPFEAAVAVAVLAPAAIELRRLFSPNASPRGPPDTALI